MRGKTERRLFAKTFGPVRPQKKGEEVRKALDGVGQREPRAKALEIRRERPRLPASAKDGDSFRFTLEDGSEVVSKADVYMAYLAFKSFCEDAE